MAYSYRNLGRNGRLGNQLFQIAGTLGQANAEATSAHFPHWPYTPYFTISPILFGDIPRDAVDMGRDFLQDVSLFANCVESIYESFAFSEFAYNNIHNIFPALHPANKTTHRTGVHIRRGDYTKFGHFFTLCPIHYFTTCMAEVEELFPDSTFLVFTDDPDWCHAYFDGRANTVVVSEKVENTIEREMAEFALMASCDSLIISNSTFSWWAAFLSHSEHVYVPDKWYNEGLAHLDATKFLLPKWKQRSIAPLGPYKPEHVTVVESSSGLIATNTKTHMVHHMNSTAAILFELCTGSNPQERIIELMQKVLVKHGIEMSTSDVEAMLSNLISRGLIATDGVAELV